MYDRDLINITPPNLYDIFKRLNSSFSVKKYACVKLDLSQSLVAHREIPLENFKKMSKAIIWKVCNYEAFC